MKLWLRRYDNFKDEADGDAEFWQRMTPDERVDVVEQLRREWLERNGRVDEGLRRTARALRAHRR